MRAAFVLAGLGAGGAERVISLIAAHWVQKGWKVRIIAFDGPDAPIYHAFDPRIALMRLNLPTVSGKRLPGLVTNLRRIRSEEHTSDLQSLMRNSYAVFCLNKKKH